MQLPIYGDSDRPLTLRYLTHPQVVVDPDTPVMAWHLSEAGRSRVTRAIDAGWMIGTKHIISSAEQKAIDTAQPIAEFLSLRLEVRPATHENDRSATGYLPHEEFQEVADTFFANPNESVRGWERATDAQSRIVKEFETILARPLVGDVLFVGHGGVGTLAYCRYSGLPIDRKHDQQGDGGNYFSISVADRQVLHGWTPMENDAPVFTGITGA